MLRAVLDTNVIVSGMILNSGPPAEILSAWRERRFELIVCPAILAELHRVLRLPRIARAYSVDAQDVQDLLDLLSARAVITTGNQPTSAALRDPKDIPILACAIEGHADYIVSGDHDLRSLGRYQDIPIVSPAAFAAALSAER